MVNLNNLEEELKLRGFSSLTLKAYIRHNKEFLKFINKNPEEILQDDIQKYLTYLTEKKLRSGSISLVLCALKFYYSEILKKQIFSNVKIQKSEKRITEELTKGDIEHILEVIHNPKHKLMVNFMYVSGLKVSEVVKLKISDIDEKIGRIVSNKKERYIILSESLLHNLKDYLANRNKESEFLFPTKQGHLSIRMAQKIVNKAAKKTKLGKRVYCHLLRAYFKRILLEEGNDDRMINGLLGYSGITKLSKEQLKKIRSPFDISIAAN
ncbi:tyrosine-type recombinase/integrase [Candidatus Woesearchaeota archaeon]|nr:tyrosine-type recombinase/integrase [Candidatus Woesearchaeota archaeon]